MTERYFITGTDTEVGKTVASTALLRAAQRNGRVTVGYKPVASGSEITSEGLRNSDALELQHNSNLALPYISVNPYTFAEPTSPHIVSESEKRPIEFTRLTKGLRELEAQTEWILVEGAGGWFTPLTSTKTFADWVIQEQLPVILVVGVKLGCINHAILTAQAVTQAGLCLAGWIANDIVAPGRRHTEYLSTLKRVLDAPFLGEIPWLGTRVKEVQTDQYLDFNALCVSRHPASDRNSSSLPRSLAPLATVMQTDEPLCD